MAEAKASLQAITVVEELGFRKIVLEGDNSTVIKKINDENKDQSLLSTFIKEIKNRSTRFESFTCTFSGRAVNQAAHKIAKEGKRWPNQSVWIEEAPQNVMIVVERDKRLLTNGRNGSEELDLH